VFDILAHHTSNKGYLIVLAYHRICDRQNTFLSDEEVVSATPEDFEKQLKFVKRHFSVIGLGELQKHCLCGSSLPKKPVMITFDDGYKDNYLYAFNILKKHDLKATFFISTSYIENRDLFWWDKIAYIFKSSRKKVIKFRYARYEREYKMPEDRTTAIREIQQIVKRTYGLNLSAFMEQLALNADVSIQNTPNIGDEMLLTWSEIKDMKLAGMDIGSHTKTHRVLSTLYEDELLEELSESKNILESHLEEPICSLSYPVGGDSSFNQKVKDFSRRCNYLLAFSYGKGFNNLGEIDPFNIKRLGLDGASLSFFKGAITMPRQLIK